MTRDYDPDRAAQRARECGRDCGCPFAMNGELCDFGESKAERIKDERGCTIYTAAFLISLPPLTFAAWWTHHWVLAVFLAWLTITVGLLVALHGVFEAAKEVGQAQDDDDLPLYDQLAAHLAEELVPEVEAYLRSES